jgi:hypothetical protein
VRPSSCRGCTPIQLGAMCRGQQSGATRQLRPIAWQTAPAGASRWRRPSAPCESNTRASSDSIRATITGVRVHGSQPPRRRHLLGRGARRAARSVLAD